MTTGRGNLSTNKNKIIKTNYRLIMKHENLTSHLTSLGIRGIAVFLQLELFWM
ncbi:hypothetical protein DDI_2624 [Dickeya dianthicola RNS04.9]|nr:hypothetical protein DDI_2624 [Dickeya dianthicola RNS04.9]